MIRAVCVRKAQRVHQDLNTKEILSLIHLPTIPEETSPKRKKETTQYDLEDLSTDVKKKLKF